MNSKKVGEQQKYIEEKIEELHLPVAKSAEALCREILRYEGETARIPFGITFLTLQSFVLWLKYITHCVTR